MRVRIIPLIWVAVALNACAVLPSPTPTPPPELNIPPTLALTNAVLIDGSGAAPVQPAVLLIGGGKILSAGPAAQIIMPQGIEVIDLGGRTVLPGFFNAHVHGAVSEKQLAAWAQSGVTSVCDMSAGVDYTATFSFRDAARARPELARLAAAGPMLTVPGGYPIAHWGVAALTASSPAEAVKITNTLLDAGADYIKIPLESGRIFGQNMPIHPPEQAKAIVEAAHRRGANVVAHISITADLEKALDAGVDVLGHMSTDRVPDEVLRRVVAQGVIWIPTLELWEKVGPFKERVEDNLRRFAALGGVVALGTDFLGAPDIDFDEGLPLFEISRMAAAGMTPMQIITAATSTAARACGQPTVTGTLRAGLSADLLVVNANPLEDLGALEQTWLVMHAGEVIVDRR